MPGKTKNEPKNDTKKKFGSGKIGKFGRVTGGFTLPDGGRVTEGGVTLPNWRLEKNLHIQDLRCPLPRKFGSFW